MGNLDLKIIDKSTSSEIKQTSKIHLNIIDKENDDEKKIKNLKFKFMKEDYSNVATDLLPIDLISYANNKMNIDIFDEYDKNEVKLSTRDRIVMVTVYLPITVEKINNKEYIIVETDNSLLFRYVNTIKMNQKKNSVNIKWIGLLKDLYNYPKEEQEEIIEFLRQNDYYAVTPEKKELDYFIYYLERVMYPVFLNNSFNPTDEIYADSKKYVDAFYNVNREYANKILLDYQEEDLISIHNIGLAFVADRLMHSKPNSHIGIYIHIDLPSSDVINMFPYYQEIFRCFILCDVIGFHDFTSARNFLTIMRRFFGIFYTVSKNGIITLSRSGRTIIVHIKQAQLDYQYIEELTENIEFKKYDEIYKKESEEFNLVVTSFDYLYCIMPICTKLKAIDLFLENYKELQEKALFRMWIKEYDNEILDYESEEIKELDLKINKKNKNEEDNIDDEEEEEIKKYKMKMKMEQLEQEKEYKKTIKQRFIKYKEKINQMATNIMKKYNNNKLIKIEYINDINDAQANNIFKRLALFKNTDIFLYPKFFFTQSLIVKEFLSMQSHKQKNYGTVVNENMALMDIQSAQVANPYDPEMIAKALKKVYGWKFTPSRITYDLKAIKKVPLLEWVKSFLLDLKNVKVHDNSNKQVMNIDTKYIEVIKYGENFKHLEKRKILKYYKNSHSRLILFNYENTLKEIPEFLNQDNVDDVESILNNEKKMRMISPDKRIITILKSLCNDKQNMVFIISCYDIRILQKMFCDIDNLGLCGENGFYYKYPYNKEFKTLVNLTNTSWKEQVLKIMKMFSERVEGAKIQEMASCISWSYTINSSNSYFTQIQAEEIKNHLISIINTSKLDLITQNNGTLLIRPHDVNKGAFLAKVLQDKIVEKNFDFIFVLGNGETDEEMFKYLKSAKKYFNNFKEKIKVISVTVNKQVSLANYFLNNIDDCLEILDSLIHKERSEDVKISNFLKKKIYYNDYEYEYIEE
jgi:trehalose 6-phosphate synthase/phosphatase